MRGKTKGKTLPITVKKIKVARTIEDIKVEEVDSGWDNGISYSDMYPQLVEQYRLSKQKSSNTSINKRIYILILLIQIKNGSRISEACDALPLFLVKGFDKTITVKIAKSKSIKYRKLPGGEREQFTTKQRFRTITFPQNWVPIKEIDQIEQMKVNITSLPNLEQCCLNYMLRNNQCNTHSLRYAKINNLIVEEKVPLSTVAAYVGHKNTDQLVCYTQNKEIDKLHEL